MQCWRQSDAVISDRLQRGLDDSNIPEGHGVLTAVNGLSVELAYFVVSAQALCVYFQSPPTAEMYLETSQTFEERFVVD